MQADFKARLKAKNVMSWFGPPGDTDLWQAVDNGVGAALVRLYGEAQDEWQHDDENMERWDSCRITASERRILMTFWAAEAWVKLCSPQYARVRAPVTPHTLLQ